MGYTVSLKSSAERDLEYLPLKMHDHVVTRILSLRENPRPFGAKKLHGRESYKIRVGDYRILYTIDDGRRMVEVISIGHRREVYR